MGEFVNLKMIILSAYNNFHLLYHRFYNNGNIKYAFNMQFYVVFKQVYLLYSLKSYYKFKSI